MKSKKVIWVFRIFLLLALLEATSLRAFATNDLEKISLDGNWTSKSRSIVQIPISASIYNSVISIVGTIDRDIAIRIISDEGIVVYKQEISQSKTASIIINIDGLAEGEYLLEISSPVGGVLWGSFKY